MSDAAAVLAADGVLAQAVPGFRARQGQIAMARQVEQALAAADMLIVEAGTGIGKTFAYLVPALMSRQRVIISTGTRNLQDQLFHDDLPRVCRALGLPARIELLKGRGNYLCRHRAEIAHSDLGREQDQLARLNHWAAQTTSGDLAETDILSERSPLWFQVTSTHDNCLGSKCAQIDNCFVAKARQKAQKADIVVVNHHLLCADLALKDEGFGELLSDADAVIIDEAHQFPAILGQFFGFGITAKQCRDLLADVQAAASDAGDMPQLMDMTAGVGEALTAVQQVLPFELGRLDHAKVMADGRLHMALDRLVAQMQELTAALDQVAGRNPDLLLGHRRSEQAHERLQRWLSSQADGSVRWAERQRAGFALHCVPLDVAPAMAQVRERQSGAWVFTSATLAVGERFEHFAEQLGLEDAVTAQYPSPFDYTRNTMLYIPRHLPPPNKPDYLGKLLDEILPLIRASDGGAFVLCTSNRAVEELGYALAKREEWPVLIQNQAPRKQLLDEFRSNGHAVLVGTSSFWEGVDVRGHALRLVVIDRLPFASPSDPLLKARIDQIDARGGNAFFEHQVPQAILTLKQGVGRLIRDYDDRGVLVIGDRRIAASGYGRTFLHSLPPMPVTYVRDEAEAFLSSLEPAAT